MRRAGRAAGALIVGGMEACWLLAALALLQAWTGRSLPFLWMAAGALLAAASWHATAGRGPRRQVALRLGSGIAWTAAAWAAAAPTALPPSTAALPPALAAATAWGWGCRVAAARPDPVQFLREFQTGLIALLAVASAAAWQRVSLPGLAPAACAFFLLFAAGAPVARSVRRFAWPNAGARRTWIALSAANCAAILCLGAAAASVLTPEVLDAVLAAVSAAWQIVLDALHAFMRSLAALVPASGPIEGRLPGPSGTPERPIPYHEILQLPEWLRWSAEAGTVIVWIVLISVALWRTVSEVAAWLRRQAVDLEGADIEKVGGAFRRDLIRLLWKIRRCRADVMEWARSRLGREPAAGAAAVRRRYRRLLAWAAAGGCRRPPAQTPYEFLVRLCAWRPHCRAAFEMLTEQYVRARYGGFSPAPEDLEAVEGAWRAIRSRRRKLSPNPFNSPQDSQ